MGADGGPVVYRQLMAKDGGEVLRGLAVERLNAATAMEKRRFRRLPVESESIVGWVNVDDPLTADYDGLAKEVNGYIRMRVRYDKWSLPGQLVKARLARRVGDEKSRLGLERLPKDMMKELKELVIMELRGESTPRMSTCDVVVSGSLRWVRFFGSAKACGEFMVLWAATFGVSLKERGVGELVAGLAGDEMVLESAPSVMLELADIDGMQFKTVEEASFEMGSSFCAALLTYLWAWASCSPEKDFVISGKTWKLGIGGSMRLVDGGSSLSVDEETSDISTDSTADRPERQALLAGKKPERLELRLDTDERRFVLTLESPMLTVVGGSLPQLLDRENEDGGLLDRMALLDEVESALGAVATAFWRDVVSTDVLAAVAEWREGRDDRMRALVERVISA